MTYYVYKNTLVIFLVILNDVKLLLYASQYLYEGN